MEGKSGRPEQETKKYETYCSIQVGLILKSSICHIITKSRDITLPTKVHIVKAMVLPVVMFFSPQRKLSAKEWMLLNCGVGEDS